MTKPKKPEPNPIEEAIGDRATEKLSQTDLQKVSRDVKEAVEQKTSKMKNPGFPLDRSEIPDEPSHQEMLTLEELNRQTEERLQEPDEIRFPQEPTAKTILTPVSKPESQPVTKTSSPESPPQKIVDSDGIPRMPNTLLGKIDVAVTPKPVEDIELSALRKYILEDGFVLATVSFHIMSLCAEPLTSPSTTRWDFKDRAMIPDMVLALLNQPGYIEGIWPSLKIVMGSNAGNAAWTAGISTTIAFFDVIRTLPALKELQNETI